MREDVLVSGTHNILIFAVERQRVQHPEGFAFVQRHETPDEVHHVPDEYRGRQEFPRPPHPDIGRARSNERVATFLRPLDSSPRHDQAFCEEGRTVHHGKSVP